MRVIRQGDVMAIPLDSAPEGERTYQKSRLIRRGEHGGKHEIATLERAHIFSIVDEATNIATRYIEVLDNTQIVHNEHGSVQLSPGFYAIRIQREFFENQGMRLTGD